MAEVRSAGLHRKRALSRQRFTKGTSPLKCGLAPHGAGGRGDASAGE